MALTLQQVSDLLAEKEQLTRRVAAAQGTKNTDVANANASRDSAVTAAENSFNSSTAADTARLAVIENSLKGA